MRKMIIAMVAAIAVSGCSTTERDVGVGAGVGALAGGLIDGGKGALVGAAIGAGTGLLVRNLRNGYCQYRDNRGRLFTARC
ncbi:MULTISPECIES: YMGG-like glycine zipper-containing protein [unclassified Mesorhizobium]|uniref:YMGG-like glycine zipper-containing protein n=1 Tax=unclassified Mesorhizobium TaxID=325217 RepID=UPI000FE4DD51|nr:MULTISPECIES: YMGG-like glycine zipper-containing protein [unclassified Mesorhizobium]RWI28293.1 MAG: hypothetical protein EOQ92_09250 [Mesorhizobium sp.]RWK50897.1 MAG: hypothetical protein EOR47_08815 [Mesorhizobium sp.]RWK96495.1 MAG: hypothetical protein EOR53_09295 [Mesorhizobium sp.]RWL08902.1 MAG: hypothetical protein EOR45_09395 [Mesorhizobium sp.]RWM97212.1 MAG: hypothetical protein EOR84_12795 [Mesorhizobium sp.]